MRAAIAYPTLFGDVDLEVVSVSVDGVDLPYAQISRLERTVALHRGGREKWESAHLRLKATLPEKEIADGPWSDLAVVAVVSEKVTNSRSTAQLNRGHDGFWHGGIEVSRLRHLNRVVLSLAVVATVDSMSGRMVGATERDWFVDLTATTPTRQRELEIVEADFREGPDEWLRPYQDSPWIVETSGDIPTVYLNTAAVEGLIDLLHAPGGSAAEKMLRDMTASQIAQDAWTAMFHTAVGDLELDDDGTPLMPSGWRESVLRSMLPDVLPGRQLTDALYDINERRIKGFGWSELQTSIQHAAGKRSQTTKKLTNAVRSISVEKDSSR
ncbi:hypothetical protein ACFQY4_05350 [Catellatospora bangladeshensis]|uniref:Uncharacterized protein n=1 Tax=Catellatospora bangladeshensis TaxID=310355 RepID=A0A8J3NM03_9ACTN|nr:hypothetical protein [Catellatospora bangladeshensis]GIF83135.1 hypothetical protein Cba03nite_44840 [Catellatospora bangladeshensis]